MRIVILTLISIFSSTLLRAEEPNIAAPIEHCIFTPPKDWDLVTQQPISQRVKINFIGKSNKEFRPSLNFVIEKTKASMNDYIAAIKKIHEADPNNRWRDLGSFPVESGEARLVEIDSKIPFGNIRILQLITIKNNAAHIITGTALKEEFSNYYKDFQEVFRSLRFTSDLISAVPNLEKQTALKERYLKMLAERKKEKQQLWNSFQETLASALKDEFLRSYKEFTDIFSSPKFTLDLIGNIPSQEKQAAFQDQYLKTVAEKKKEKEQLWLSFQENAIKSMKEAFSHSYKQHQDMESPEKSVTLDNNPFEESQQLWLSFQEAVINEYKEMGAYWQVLMLQSAQEKLEEE